MKKINVSLHVFHIFAMLADIAKVDVDGVMELCGSISLDLKFFATNSYWDLQAGLGPQCSGKGA